MCRVGIESQGGHSRYRMPETVYTRDIDEFDEGCITGVRHYDEGIKRLKETNLLYMYFNVFPYSIVSNTIHKLQRRDS